MRNLVSVVIPCYRCAKTIVRAVDSVLTQSILADEIILVDDFSDDAGATVGVLNAIRDAHLETTIIVVTLPNNVGPGGARNAGWAAATGEFLAFLDADDSWHPQKLEVQLGWMLEHPEVVLTGAQSMKYSDWLMAPALKLPPLVRPVGRLRLLLANCLPTRTVMLRRGITQRFDPQKRYAEDYLLWLEIVLMGRSSCRLEVPLGFSYKADFGGAGLSASLW